MCLFEKLKAPVYTQFDNPGSLSKLTAYDLIPLSGGFLLLTSDGKNSGAAAVCRITYSAASGKFSRGAELPLGMNLCNGGTLNYHRDDRYYAVVYYAGSARGFYILNGAAGLSVAAAPALDGTGTLRDFSARDGIGLFLSEGLIDNSAGIVITAVNDALSRTYSAAFGGEKKDAPVALFSAADGGVIVFSSTMSTGGDVGANFGMNDVWVFKIK
jgi:hypothetical protein